MSKINDYILLLICVSIFFFFAYKLVCVSISYIKSFIRQEDIHPSILEDFAVWGWSLVSFIFGGY